jgi:hypothetical protein
VLGFSGAKAASRSWAVIERNQSNRYISNKLTFPGPRITLIATMKILQISCATFLMASTLPLVAGQLPAAGSQNQWTAGNGSIQLSVDTSTGVIDHLVDQVSHEDYCNQTLADATSDTDGNR